MENFFNNFKYSYRYISRILLEIVIELYFYYSSPYPIHLIIGGFRRISRRLKCLWVPRGKGRPPVSIEIVDLILEMKRSNWSWGVKRIRDELKFLGIFLHKKTVSRILKEYGMIPPPMKFDRPTWRSLYKSYKHIWGMDLTSIFDGKINQIFILTIIDIVSREIVLMKPTYLPNKLWIIQQFRNIAIDNYDFPNSIVIDNDGLYGKWIDPFLDDNFGIKTIRIPHGQPWQNGHVERNHLSLKNEIFSRVIVSDLEQVDYLCKAYRSYFNNTRPHQGIYGEVPKRTKTIAKDNIIRTSKVNKKEHIDGLFTEFVLAA